MAMAAGHLVAHQSATTFSGAPNDEVQILLIMVASGAIIFIDHARSGEPQTGNQYLALGIVGFTLLTLGEFWPEAAFGFAVLILISVILNSPRGLPFIPKKKTSKTSSKTNVSNAATDIAKGK